MTRHLILALLVSGVLLAGCASRLAATSARAYQIDAPPAARIGEPTSVLVSVILTSDRPESTFVTLTWTGPPATGVSVAFTDSAFQLDGGLCDPRGSGCEWRLSTSTPLGRGKHPVVSLTVTAAEPGSITIEAGDTQATITVSEDKDTHSVLARLLELMSVGKRHVVTAR